MSDASQLYVLQASDTRITQLQSQIREVEAALRGDSELDRSRVVAAAATATRHSSEAVAQAAEAEMAALDARIRSLDRRLYDGSVRNPQELLEMQHELEMLRGRARDAEDRAIALLGAALHSETTRHYRGAVRDFLSYLGTGYPEVSSFGGDNLRFGVDHNTFPQARTYTFGVRFGI